MVARCWWTGGTTETYAKFDPAYLGKARKALDAWMADLAKDVPRLKVTATVNRPSRGACAR